MADLNKVFLMGSLTFDPELRRTPSGTGVAELRMVTSRSWMTKEGERREEKLYIDVTVWDRQAENCCQFLKKGSGIHVEGSLKMDTWDDKTTGEKRSKIRIHADRVQFLDGRRGEGGGGGDDDYSSREPTARRSGGAPSRGYSGSGESNGAGRPAYQAPKASGPSSPSVPHESEEDDIPF